MLTQDKFTEFKQDYDVYGTSTTTDEYGNEQRTTTYKGKINVMWHPLRDEASVAEYGDKISSMLECVLYEGDVETFDRIIIGSDTYEVVGIKPYNTHLLIHVQRLV